MLDRRLPTPLYHQVKALLLQQIESGTLQPDERLPTEQQLIERFGVSRITVRQALHELSTLGYIRREQGRGTFVQPRPLEQGPRDLTSFTKEMRRHGLAPSSQVLEQGIVAAAPETAAVLGIDSGAPVFRLRRLRLADGEPMGIQTACLPMTLVPGIDGERFTDASLYDVLRHRYGLRAARAREKHAAVSVGADDAALLRVAPGTPALAAERVAHLADGRPLEHVHSIMRGDRYAIVLDLTARPGAR